MVEEEKLYVSTVALTSTTLEVALKNKLTTFFT